MALQVVNPVNAVGSAVFFLAFLGFMLWSYRNRDDLADFSVGLSYEYVFSVILALVPLIASASYLMMAFDLGFVEVAGRTVAYIRYYEWSVSTPLLLFGLAVLTQRKRILYELVGLDVFMIFTGFLASVTSGVTKLAFLGASTVAFLLLLYLLLFRASKEMEKRPETLQKLFHPLKWLTVVVWTLFPVVWMLSSDGYAMVSFSLSQTLFMALDLTAKIGYAFIVLYQLNRLSSSL